MKGLRQVRQKRGLTQVQLAAISGVQQTTISLLEIDPRPNPKWITVDALAKALKVAPHDLFPVVLAGGMSDDTAVPAADRLDRAPDARAMTPDELRAALSLGQSTFYKHQSLGRFERFELKPRIGPRRYSRKLVQEYLDGEPSSRTFGQGGAVVRGGRR